MLQGNGYEKDKLQFEDDKLYILDMYNADLWPHDTWAKTAIDNMVELKCGTTDTEYLSSLEEALQKAFREFQPDLILYNAGTDILEGDPLGRSGFSLLCICGAWLVGQVCSSALQPKKHAWCFVHHLLLGDL